MIGINTITNNINTLISQNTTSDIEVKLLSASYETLTENSTNKVQSISDLPPAALNLGRFIFINDNNRYTFSDGNKWDIEPPDTTKIWTWGSNANGFLGNNSVTRSSRSSPSTVEGDLYGWTQISLGGYHSLGLTSNGALWAWGRNSVGQLGDGTIVDKSSPVFIRSTVSNWLQVSAGYQHSAAITANGRAFCWGSNGQGRLGDNTSINRNLPTRVSGTINDWKQISAGGFHTVALRGSGEAYAWGRGSEGQLGTTLSTDSFTPALVSGSLRWRTVVASNRSTYGIDSGITNYFLNDNASYIFSAVAGQTIEMPYSPLFDWKNRDFTIEFWIKAFASASGAGIFGQFLASNQYSGIALETNATRDLLLSVANGSNTLGINARNMGTITNGQWNHVAITRNSSTRLMTSFINGVLTTSTSVNFTIYSENFSPFLIGSKWPNSTSASPHISNFRISSAVLYTENFSTSTLYKLNATTNTIFLSLNDNELVDKSANKIPIFGFGISKLAALADDGVNLSLNNQIYNWGLITNSNTGEWTQTETVPKAINSTLSNWLDVSVGRQHALATRYGTIEPNIAPKSYSAEIIRGGSAQQISFPITSRDEFSFGFGDFTIECWIYYNDYIQVNSAAAMSILDLRSGTGAQDYAVLLRYNQGTRQWRLAFRDNVNEYDSGIPIPLKKWVHLAVTRTTESNGVKNLRLYVNGILVPSAIVANATELLPTATIGQIGRNVSSAEVFYGYISNLRVTNGKSLFNTVFFNVPTEPLVATTETSLLTCHANTFRDDSFFNNTITQGNLQRISEFNPFEQYPLSGSAHFPGTSHYRIDSFESQFNLVSDFTVEFWIYISQDQSTNAGVISYGFYVPAGVEEGYEIYFNAAGQLECRLKSNLSIVRILTTDVKVTLHRWNHIALTRQNGIISLYYDGVRVAPTVNYPHDIRPSIYGTSNPLIGINTFADPDVKFAGFLSNMRISDVCRYTDNFQRPLNAFRADSNTKFLAFHGNLGLSKINIIPINPIGSPSPTLNVLHSPFESERLRTSGSMYFDNNDYSIVNAHPYIRGLVNGVATIEMWIKPISWSSNNQFKHSLYGSFEGTYKWLLYVEGGPDNQNGTLKFIYSTANNVTAISNSNTANVELNKWTHVAVEVGGSGSFRPIRFFVNGTLVADLLQNMVFLTVNDSTIKVGTAFTDYNGFHGYISNLRHISGTYLYQTSFTPSKEPLLPIQNTVVLVGQNNINNDRSENNWIIQSNSPPSFTKDNPFGLIASTGTLIYSWGQNTVGQLGQNIITTPSVTPKLVSGNITNWTQIAAGGYHNLAVRSDGTAWSWGRNTNGELGDNSNNSRLSPVSVVGVDNWLEVSASNGIIGSSAGI